ncbi:ATP phosphoribosyltransferase regulatory subunit [Palleronia caenipelagi]|uniref:Histidine--tRNA ligase n=1 Tax=Palleronia caenipelagi TaxID=2489174 RepID=A0A547QB23_9RHOB|nr:ATP phosphoribosyltransferase regulatory subunit [Palleronia caenipelagi]TRD23593.1 ATP phosphoribosyltransferase regulatory subunit [Palleronia caenipelagi]
MTEPVSKSAEKAEAARFLAAFVEAGATPVEADVLLPAETLLDLYGEDIRARAFTTHGPDGEAMLRPDFTVPVVQMHMARGGEPARYAYAGEVFRQQMPDSDRSAEYLQAGFELFGGTPEVADAECFALFHRLLAPLRPRVMTGDIGILTAVVRGLSTTEARKTALMRHLWRPRRFRSLIDRYSGRVPLPEGRRKVLDACDPFEGAGPELGLRSRADVEARLATLRQELETPPLSEIETGLLDDLLSLREMSDVALGRLRDLAVDMPSLSASVEGLARRLDALDAAGISPETLPFEASHGRSTMEYYDGFVFAFSLPGRLDLPPIATGGRYDALTAVLGQGHATPAVGGVIRPALTLEAE